MTCIIGYVDKKNKVSYMGGDSYGFSSGSYAARKRKDVKVFQKGEFLYGYTTSYRMGQLIQYKFKEPEIKDNNLHSYMCTEYIDALRKCFESNKYSKLENNQATGGNFIVIVRGRMFEIQNDFQVAEPAFSFASVGCGEDYAYGCLFGLYDIDIPIKLKILTALKSAQEFSGYVRGPFKILSTED